MTDLGVVESVGCEIVEATVGGVAYLAARFDVRIVTQGPIQVAALMDAIAARVPTALTERVYAWPVGSINAPAALVGYPTDPIQFDVTFQRGSDRVTFPLFFCAGKESDRTARDVLSAAITGTNAIRDALDADDGHLSTP